MLNMKGPKFFPFVIVLLVASHYSFAQTPLKQCDDIRVEAKILNPSNNQSDGSIDFILPKPIDSYRIFFLNAGPDKTDKQEVEKGKLQNLNSGSFDFLIIDTTRKGCVRLHTVVLN